MSELSNISKPTLLFDINETVLNLAAIKHPFEALFKDTTSPAHWFSTLLQASTVAAITGLKTNFADLACATLEKLSREQGITPTNEEISAITAAFAALPAHEDIIPALTNLRAHGFQTIAFSNSATALVNRQISNAGLATYFDDIISVEEVGSFKPDARVYAHAATKCGRKTSDLWLTAVHDWDTHGAKCAGLKAAWLQRGNNQYNPLYQPPDITATSMTEIADQLINLHA